MALLTRYSAVLQSDVMSQDSFRLFLQCSVTKGYCSRFKVQQSFSSWLPFIFCRDSWKSCARGLWERAWHAAGDESGEKLWVFQVYASEKQMLPGGSQSDFYGLTSITSHTHCHGQDGRTHCSAAAIIPQKSDYSITGLHKVLFIEWYTLQKTSRTTMKPIHVWLIQCPIIIGAENKYTA